MAVQYISHAVATGTGTTITWTIPAHNVDDLIILGVRLNSTSTSIDITSNPSGYTMIFGRREVSGAHPNWVFAKNATGSDTASATLGTSATGWRAIAIIIRGHNPNTGYTYPMFSDAGGSHFDTESTLTGGAGQEDPVADDDSLYVVLSMNRLAASGTATTTATGVTFTEAEDSYASNLHTTFAYSTLDIGNYLPTTQLTTSDANSTKSSIWRMVVAPDPASGVTGTMAATMPEMTAAAEGDVRVDGTMASTMPEMTAALAGDVIVDGTLAADLPEMTAAAEADVVVDGDLAADLPEMTADMSGAVGEVTPSGTLAADLPEMTSDMSGAISFAGTMAADLPEMTADMIADVVASGTIEATLPEMTAAFVADVLVDGTLAADLPEMTAAFVGGGGVSSALAADLPEMTAEFAASITLPLSPEHTVRVPAEDRSVYVERQTRQIVLPDPDTTVYVELETRTVKVKAESRTVTA